MSFPAKPQLTLNSCRRMKSPLQRALSSSENVHAAVPQRRVQGMLITAFPRRLNATSAARSSTSAPPHTQERR